MGIFGLWSSSNEPDSLLWKPWGRYSDAYKSDVQYDAWDRAQSFFADGRWHEGLIDMMKYFSNPLGDNVVEHRGTTGVSYRLYQGSSQATITLHDDHLRAEVTLVEGRDWHLSLLRMLLETNYGLKYCRYALRDNSILLVFDTQVVDLDAYKMYYALKELLLHADRDDDLIAGEWASVEMSDVDHIRSYSMEEADALRTYTLSTLARVGHYLKRDNELSEVNRAIGVMEQLFALDYLCRPQGLLGQKVAEILQWYLQPDHTHEDANRHAQHTFERWHGDGPIRLKGEFYQFPSTFGVQEACTLEAVIRMIDAEWSSYKWYIRRGDMKGGLNYAKYVIGQILHRYAPPMPIRRLFEIAYQMIAPDLFQAFGYERLVDSNGSIIKKRLERRLQEATGDDHAILNRNTLKDMVLKCTTPVNYLDELFGMIREWGDSDSVKRMSK